MLIEFRREFLLDAVSLLSFFPTVAQRGALGQPVDRRRPTSMSVGATGVPPYSFVVPSLCHMPATSSVTSPRLALTNLGKSDTQQSVCVWRLMYFTLDLWGIVEQLGMKELIICS